MLKTAVLAALAVACLLSPVEARQRHIVTCVETGTVMRPACTGKDNNPFSGARSIRVTMHREPHAVAKTAINSDQVAHGRKQPDLGLTAGIVRSVSGATAHVAAGATHAFQCFVDALDRQGYPIRFLGGWRAHGSVPGSLHPAGLAMDVNQIARNVTKPAMPSNEIALANGCGLISGRQWRSADSGHEQLGGWAGHYASHHRHRYASVR